MNRHRIEHWCPSAMRNVVVLVCFAAALLFPASALAVPNVLGFYRGFFQSDIDLRSPHSAELNVDLQRGTDWFGTLHMKGLQPFTCRGQVEADETAFKGQCTGPDGDVKCTGSFQDLGNGGALVLLSYKSNLSATDHGVIHLLRAFVPPDPCVDRCTPDIAGTWSGTAQSFINFQSVALALQITSQEGNKIDAILLKEKVETDELGSPRSYDLWGTIDVMGNIVFIGVGGLDRVTLGTRFLENLKLFGSFSGRIGATGAVDLGTFTAVRR